MVLARPLNSIHQWVLRYDDCIEFHSFIFWCCLSAVAILILISLLLPSVQIDSVGAKIYVADLMNRLIRVVLTSNGAVSTLAGSGAIGGADGIGVAASFNGPLSVTLDSSGQILYVAERDGTCALWCHSSHSEKQHFALA